MFASRRANLGVLRQLVLMVVVASSWGGITSRFQPLIGDEAAAWRYLEEYSSKISAIKNQEQNLKWTHDHNMTEYNQQQLLDFARRMKPYYEEVARNASMFDYTNFSSATLRKVFTELADKGWTALSDDKYNMLEQLKSNMETAFGEAAICKMGSARKYSLIPDLSDLFATSRDYDELLWAWKNWRDVTGRSIRSDYVQFVQLSNEAARLNGHSDAGEIWRKKYDAENYNLQQDVERIYTELEPFYIELHTYVREKLKAVYGEDNFPESGHIPAHILGNMWAGSWTAIEDLLLPFDGYKPVNATPAIQNMSVLDMFHMSDEFFTSLGLEPATEEFWEKSMFERPTDGSEVMCQASAWDFDNGYDLRISQCTRKTMEDFITVHHEMGHIQYYLQYKDLLYPFRGGANPGFHEAVGDVLALSVSTPKHLKAVGLIDDFTTTNEDDINYLLGIALDKIVFLPFGKLMDDFRWAVFAGELDETNLNAGWWSKRCEYQGVSPPVERTEEDFDAGALFHVPANIPYVRYFVSYILQFQFHKALCETAGHTGPLHTCDIYQSKEAGKKLGDMLKLGSSREWPEALEAVIGSKVMSAEAMVEYFQPLKDWLEDYNNRAGAERGWSAECPTNLPNADTIGNGTCSEES